MMTGEKVTADNAEKMGMIYKVFSDKTFINDVMGLATIIAKMPTKGLGYTKRLLNQSFSNDLFSQLDAEGKMQVIASKTEDHNEGVSAFLEKREPKFTGK